MDQERFDQLARLLGASGSRRAGLRAALGGLLGAGGMAALDAEAKRRGSDADAAKKRRRKRCKPACGSGYECVKVGKARECVCRTGVTCGEACCAPGQGCVEGACRATACDPPCANGYACEGGACICRSGIACGNACCAAGQVCDNGACAATPEPDRCIAPGEPCKGVGRPCCEGRTCSSGQGGERDIACYVHKTGACQSTADCVYGTACIDGRCGLVVPPPAALGAPCDPEIGQQCATPGAACMAYDGPDAPPGPHCVLPLRRSCTAASECESHACGYANGATIAAGCERACAGSAGHPCGSDGDCLVGATCVGGTCREETACDVCPGGGCAFSSIVAAYEAMPSGSTITIAPGAYAEPLLKRDAPPYGPGAKNVTFRRCGLSGRVLWKRALPQDDRIMIRFGTDPTPVTATFIGIDFDARGKDQGAIQNFGGEEPGSVARMRLLDCRFEGQTHQPIITERYSDLEVCDSVFANGTIARASEAGGIYAFGQPDLETPSTTVRVVRSSFTGNSVTHSGGGVIAWRAAVTLIDSEISGNITRNTNYIGQDTGAGIWVDPSSTLSLQGTTRVTGNVSLDTPPAGCSGIAVGTNQEVVGPYHPVAPRLSGVSSATVTGNTPAATTCSIVVKRNEIYYGGSYCSDDEKYTDVPVSCDDWCLPSGTVLGELTQAQLAGFQGCDRCCSGSCGAPVQNPQCPDPPTACICDYYSLTCI